MALLITPRAPNFFTVHRLPVPSAYVRIARMEYDKDAKTVALHLEYFVTEEDAKRLPRPQPFFILALPEVVVCTDPLSILANAEGRSTFLVAYDVVAAAIVTAMGEAGTLEAV